MSFVQIFKKWCYWAHWGISSIHSSHSGSKSSDSTPWWFFVSSEVTLHIYCLPSSSVLVSKSSGFISRKFFCPLLHKYRMISKKTLFKSPLGMFRLNTWGWLYSLIMPPFWMDGLQCTLPLPSCLIFLHIALKAVLASLKSELAIISNVLPTTGLFKCRFKLCLMTTKLLREYNYPSWLRRLMYNSFKSVFSSLISIFSKSTFRFFDKQ